MSDLSEISLRERIRLNLISAMEKEGINQVQLADKLGISKGTVNNWARGNNSPDVDMVPNICKVLNISVLDLYSPTKFERPETIKGAEANSYSAEACKLANAYDNELDKWGRQAVRELVETEAQRCKDESQLKESPLKEEPKIINLYVEPSAAGIATPTMGRDYESYALGPDDPPGAAYAVRLQGDSMEPYYPDGSIVFINHDALRDGEVGIFCVDGGTVCKQYHKEGPIVYLFSLNRKRSDADVVLMPSSNRPFYCQGRVMGQRRYPVPGK